MQHDQETDEFINNTKPLFKKRNRYRVLFFGALALAVLGGETVFSVIGMILAIGLIPLLTNARSRLEAAVWKRFSNQLHYTPTHHDKFFEPLDGVIGTIGDNRLAYATTKGVYKNRYVRIIKLMVVFDPSKRVEASFTKEYRVLEITSNQNYYHVFIDSKSNDKTIFTTAMKILSLSIKNNQRLSVEGDVDRYFRIYVPKGDAYKSLVTLTPEKLLALRNYGTKFDIEFINNKIYVITHDKIKSAKDILLYQEEALKLIENIGTDVIRTRDDVNNRLTVKIPKMIITI